MLRATGSLNERHTATKSTTGTDDMDINAALGSWEACKLIFAPGVHALGLAGDGSMVSASRPCATSATALSERSEDGSTGSSFLVGACSAVLVVLAAVASEERGECFAGFFRLSRPGLGGMGPAAGFLILAAAACGCFFGVTTSQPSSSILFPIVSMRGTSCDAVQVMAVMVDGHLA